MANPKAALLKRKHFLAYKSEFSLKMALQNLGTEKGMPQSPASVTRFNPQYSSRLVVPTPGIRESTL